MPALVFAEGSILYLLGWGSVNITHYPKTLQIAAFTVRDAKVCQPINKTKIFKSELCVVSGGSKPSKSCPVSLFVSFLFFDVNKFVH
jgi:hypothetical protein